TTALTTAVAAALATAPPAAWTGDRDPRAGAAAWTGDRDPRAGAAARTGGNRGVARRLGGPDRRPQHADRPDDADRDATEHEVDPAANLGPVLGRDDEGGAIDRDRWWRKPARGRYRAAGRRRVAKPPRIADALRQRGQADHAGADHHEPGDAE